MKLVPVWKIVEDVLSEKGRKPSPRLVLRVCERITEDINRELAEKRRHKGDDDLGV